MWAKLWKRARSCNVEEFFRNVLDPYPEADNFLNLIIIIMFYYAIMPARQNNTVEYTHKYPLKSKKSKNETKLKARVTLLYCARECVPYSLLYCLPADVSRRQTIQKSNCNKSLWYQTWHFASSLFKDIAYLWVKSKSQKRRHRTKAWFGLRKHKNYAAFSNKLVFEK